MKNKQNNFWPAYADLMTSLFFVMLILFVLSFVMFKKNNKDYVDLQEVLKENEALSLAKDSLTTTIDKLKKIVEIDSALVKLDGRYFKYNKDCKRHELNVDIQFNRDQSDLNASYLRKYHNDLIQAGKSLASVVNSVQPEDGIKYLLVIEGRAGRFEKGSPKNQRFKEPVKALSYDRANGLQNFWESKGITFNSNICEVIIAGSGFGGQCRSDNEIENRKFIIQILPKVGEMR